MNTPCKIVTNRTDYYVLRKYAMQEKYGDSIKSVQYIPLCGDNRCVAKDHLLLSDTIFEEYGSKPCTVCGIWKTRDCYYDCKKTNNGAKSACKECSYTPHPSRPFFSSAFEAYDFYVIRQEGCWDWNGPKSGGGYGSFSLNGITYKAHRFSYEYYVGSIPEGNLIRHKCDNPPCSNPEHLLYGDHKDNMQDTLDRGRFNVGSRAYNAKLTEEDVENIKKEYELGVSGKGYRSVGAKYGVSRTTVRDILLGKYWKHTK